jgi:hypothetical protein
MPVAATDQSTGKRNEQAGLVNMEALYNNIMHTYQWGNVKNAQYLDTDSFRFTSMYAR